jgi:hypothetical protein
MADFSLPDSQGEAQARADRIRAFELELEEVERDGVLRLAPDERLRLASYHRELRAALVTRFDIDVVERQKSASMGLRLAALVGALAVATGLVLFFFRTWGVLPAAAQVAIVVMAPIVALAGAEVFSRSVRQRIAAGVFVALAFAALVLNVEVLGAIAGLAPHPSVLLAYGAFGVALAYTYRHRLALAAGAACLAAWLATSLVATTGAWWLDFPMRPESVFPGVAGLALWSAAPHQARLARFPAVLRAVAMLLLSTAVLLLSRAGSLSWIPADADAVAVAYQILSFAVALAAIIGGLAWRWPEVAGLGTGLFAIASFLKLVDWWWDWMPRYLFFLLVGLLALAVSWLLQRLRRQLAKGA